MHTDERHSVGLVQISPSTLPHLPSASQTAERHFPSSPPTQGVPFARPQASSIGSHAAVLQTSVPASALHLPSTVGVVWPGSVGRPIPLSILSAHFFAEMLHQPVAGQSASTRQTPAGMHLPFELQRTDRQTLSWLAAVQGPSPSA